MIADFSSVLAMVIGWSLLLLIPIEGVRFSREANFKAIEKSDRRSKFLFRKYNKTFYIIFLSVFSINFLNFKVSLFLKNHVYTFFNSVAAANHYSRYRVVYEIVINEFLSYHLWRLFNY